MTSMYMYVFILKQGKFKVGVYAYIFLQIHKVFVSRVRLVLKCVDQGDIELIWFYKEFLFLLVYDPFYYCGMINVYW